MKSTLSILFALFLYSPSCKEVNETNNYSTKEDLQGSWEVIKTQGALSEFSLDIIYTFYKNKITIFNASVQYKGNSQITDSSFSFQSIDRDKPEIFFSYKFSNDTLIVSSQHSDQVFYMTRY